MSGFAETVGWQVKGNSEVLVVLDGGAQPLLGVLGEVVMGEERNCKEYVGPGGSGCDTALLCVQSARLWCILAPQGWLLCGGWRRARELLGCFKRVGCVLGQVA